MQCGELIKLIVGCGSLQLRLELRQRRRDIPNATLASDCINNHRQGRQTGETRMSCMCFECVSERGLDNPKMPPDGWHIEKNIKPMPDRRFDWDYWHDDYDGADGGNGLAGNAGSWGDAVEQCWEIQTEICNEY